MLLHGEGELNLVMGALVQRECRGRLWGASMVTRPIALLLLLGIVRAGRSNDNKTRRIIMGLKVMVLLLLLLLLLSMTNQHHRLDNDAANVLSRSRVSTRTYRAASSSSSGRAYRHLHGRDMQQRPSRRHRLGGGEQRV